MVSARPAQSRRAGRDDRKDHTPSLHAKGKRPGGRGCKCWREPSAPLRQARPTRRNPLEERLSPPPLPWLFPVRTPSSGTVSKARDEALSEEVASRCISCGAFAGVMGSAFPHC
ncbi:hypothetical protein HPB50_025366 [Hyalomma asiaticum]|uniref:Uncharacterized protein n=1 Tax=Hyalomma asiaticum TaxID=266040 RepID=A0ACB7T1F1_HYAAI|nr:hypothetical protein HPB50_025366 [Hyalomma asiaticum]